MLHSIPSVSSATRNAVAAVLAALPGLPAECQRAMLAVLDRPADVPPVLVDSVLSRCDAAARFNRSTRTLSAWAKAGVLRPVILPGRKRSCGFRASDIARLIAGVEGGK
jgi:hypothetical protein